MRNIRAVKPADRWISIVTAQELIAYKYEEIHKTKNMPTSRLLKFYYQFERIIRLISRLQIKPFDADAYNKFLGMPGHLDIFDRRIAATAISNGFTVVSHNGDFKEIRKAKPSLRLEDWVDEDHT